MCAVQFYPISSRDGRPNPVLLGVAGGLGEDYECTQRFLFVEGRLQGKGTCTANLLRGQSVHQGLGDYQMSGLVGMDRFWTEGIGVAVLELPLEDIVQAH